MVTSTNRNHFADVSEMVGDSPLPLGWGGGDGNRLTHIKNDLFDTIAIYSRI